VSTRDPMNARIAAPAPIAAATSVRMSWVRVPGTHCMTVIERARPPATSATPSTTTMSTTSREVNRARRSLPKALVAPVTMPGPPPRTVRPKRTEVNPR
jgi:hypothetical protein